MLKSVPLSNKFLSRLKCLHPFCYDQSSLTCIKIYSSVVSPENVVEEWILCKSNSMDNNQSSTSNEGICIYWTKIFEEKGNWKGNLKYMHLSIFIMALLVLSHINADCERGFSINRNLWIPKEFKHKQLKKGQVRNEKIW